MTVTTDLITALRDFEVSESHFDDTQLTRFISRSITRFYTFITTNFPKRYETSGTVAITSGTTTGFSLPSDCWYVTAVEIADSRTPTGYSTISRINRNERNFENPKVVNDVRDLQYDIRGSKIYPYPPATTGTLRIWYVPTEPDDPDTTVSSVPMYMDWLINDVLVEYTIATEQDNRGFSYRRDEIGRDIINALNIPLDNASSMRMKTSSFKKSYPWS